METPVTTKRPDSFEEFQRKQQAKRTALPPTDHNIPGLPSLSHEEIIYVDKAREALAAMKQTFENWSVIARALKSLRDKADRIGGRFTFDRLREREGLGGKRRDGTDILNKTRVSRLLAILEHLSEVEAWRAKLTDKQRFDWASPEAVFRHCPVFAKPKSDDDTAEKPLTPAQQDRQALAAALEEIERLKKLKADERFTPTDTADNVANTIVGMFTPGKAKAIAEGILAKLKTRRAAAIEEGLKEFSADLNAGLAGAFAAPKRKRKTGKR
jgi:hypothetical protein